ncbi:MAG TPA: ABC transporter permease [Blastocatellia bacterium]|nr:ABC transporter permease [Blastocatellia bacterium]
MNLRRTRAVARKEFLHVLRDPRSLIMALAIPMVMLLLFGYALSLDVDRIPTLILDGDRSPESRALVERFHGSRYFQILGFVEEYAAIEREMDRNRILLGLVIPRGYSRSLLSGEQATIQALLDGSDSNTASIALGYVEALVGAYALDLRSEALQRQGGGTLEPPVQPQLRVWYNTELKSKNYIVPGLIAVIMMIIAALLTSLTIAREWEMGTMEQLLSTPVRPAELVLGKMTAYFTIGMVDMAIALSVGVFLFSVPLRGSVLFLFVTCGVFLFGALCWGILLSALARSQLLAYQMGMITSFLPAFLLSGFVYAIENMPTIVQLVTYLVPARYFITALRGIFLKGIGPELIAAELAFLLAYAAATFFIATRKVGQRIA